MDHHCRCFFPGEEGADAVRFSKLLCTSSRQPTQPAACDPVPQNPWEVGRSLKELWEVEVPWHIYGDERYIYLHEWLNFYGYVGKYHQIPYVDPMIDSFILKEASRSELGTGFLCPEGTAKLVGTRIPKLWALKVGWTDQFGAIWIPYFWIW